MWEQKDDSTVDDSAVECLPSNHEDQSSDPSIWITSLAFYARLQPQLQKKKKNMETRASLELNGFYTSPENLET